LVPLLVWVQRTGGWTQLKTQRLGWHLTRGIIGMLGAACSFYSYSRLPLADAYAIAFSAPLFITALSVPVLHEHVGWRRWTAVGVGFIGVLIMLNPRGAALNLGSISALGGAVGYAGSVMLLRHMRRTETAGAQMVYPTLVTVTCTGLLMCWVWVRPTPVEWLLLLGTGLFSGTAGICIVIAYRGASATVVAPFQYTQMLWGLGYGYLLWGQTASRQTLAGAAVVILTGVYILHRETVRQLPVGSSARGAIGVGAPILPAPKGEETETTLK
jgi:drug/metabolite transporter (DMT)-like permease